MPVGGGKTDVVEQAFHDRGKAACADVFRARVDVCRDLRQACNAVGCELQRYAFGRQQGLDRKSVV